jgi:hypothetical protein
MTAPQEVTTVDTSKIRIKIGEHEFEAEGTTESVQAQLETFKVMLTSINDIPARPVAQEVKQAAPIIADTGDPTHVPLEKILHVSGRVVSLTAIPSSTEMAALLILLGHKNLRNNESVTGQEIGDGLAQSGRPVARTDRVMEKAITEAYVMKSGFKRSTRYRLTNSGNQKALATARELIGTLP